MPKNEKCFLCDKSYPAELGRWFQYTEDTAGNMNLIAPNPDKTTSYPQAFVCFQCDETLP